MRISRRSLLGGLAVVYLGGALPRMAAAARPTITVYKDPT
jgi:hypothetical protein